MGVYFKVCIRFLCVRDKTKVNLAILEADPYDCMKTDAHNAAVWKEKIKPYYEAVKANLTYGVHRYKHEGKNYHSLLNVLVPDWYETWAHRKSNVIAFSNWADGRYDMPTCYAITFYDRYGQVLNTINKIPHCEVNRFMLLLPENTHSIRYAISKVDEPKNEYASYNNVHFFNFGLKCVTCIDNGDDDISSSSATTIGENDQHTDDDDDDNDDDNDDDEVDDNDADDNDTSAEIESIASEVGIYDSESHPTVELNSESL